MHQPRLRCNQKRGEWMELTNIGTKETSEAEQDEWLEEIMNDYGDRLTILAFSYLKDWGKAQEVVQDVFVTCYKMYKITPEIISFKSWIYRVTVNRCKDVLKSSLVKRVIVNNSLFAFLRSPEPSPEHTSIKKDERELVSEGVLSLQIKYREVIILYYYENLSILEISELLNTNQNTIKTRLKRSKAILKTLLESSDINEG